MEYALIFGILIGVAFVLGGITMVDAHPHATMDLLESHSHDIHDSNFQEHFIVHTFEEVIFSVVDFFNSMINSFPIVTNLEI